MRKVRSRSGVPARDRFTALDLESVVYPDFTRNARGIEQSSIVVVECLVCIDELRIDNPSHL